MMAHACVEAPRQKTNRNERAVGEVAGGGEVGLVDERVWHLALVECDARIMHSGGRLLVHDWNDPPRQNVPTDDEPIIVGEASGVSPGSGLRRRLRGVGGEFGDW